MLESFNHCYILKNVFLNKKSTSDTEKKNEKYKKEKSCSFICYRNVLFNMNFITKIEHTILVSLVVKQKKRTKWKNKHKRIEMKEYEFNRDVVNLSKTARIKKLRFENCCVLCAFFLDRKHNRKLHIYIF